MDSSCNFLCHIISDINWIWYIVAIGVVFGIGAIWYSLLFSNAWMRVFKVEIPTDVKLQGAAFTMIMQLLASALFGLAFFVLTSISVWLSLLLLIAFCGWQKASLKFRYTKWNDYFMAALIEVGYIFVAGLVFILFALI